MTTEAGVVTREQWVEENLETYAVGLCRSYWHDEGHSYHSTCPSCGGNFMRGSSLKAERERLEGFAKAAERYAIATGWRRPE